MPDMLEERIRELKEAVNEEWERLVEELHLPFHKPPYLAVVNDWIMKCGDLAVGGLYYCADFLLQRNKREEYNKANSSEKAYEDLVGLLSKHLPDDTIIITNHPRVKRTIRHELAHRALLRSTNPELLQKLKENFSAVDVYTLFMFVYEFFAYLATCLGEKPEGEPCNIPYSISEVYRGFLEYGKIDASLHASINYWAEEFARCLAYKLRKQEEKGWDLERQIIKKLKEGTELKALEDALDGIQATYQHYEKRFRGCRL